MGSRRKIIGVTGVIGSGKSAVCRILEEKFGFYWIDADKVVHELYLPGRPGYQKIKDYFGAQFVGKKGVHRGRLRRFLLKTPQKLWILNKLIHPLVVHEMNKKIVQSKGNRICIEAVYFEPNDLGKFVDQILVIDASDEQIFKRLKSRKIPKSQLIALLKFQRKNLPKIFKRIENNDSENALRKKISTLDL
ncbi:dephospho-CoA kinase [Candidatus Peregrinibacteria bacterium]|nr:dephospho-CoA kinase [Candidatus Peregrinibacteria bacterium]